MTWPLSSRLWHFSHVYISDVVASVGVRVLVGVAVYRLSFFFFESRAVSL